VTATSNVLFNVRLNACDQHTLVRIGVERVTLSKHYVLQRRPQEPRRGNTAEVAILGHVLTRFVFWGQKEVGVGETCERGSETRDRNRVCVCVCVCVCVRACVRACVCVCVCGTALPTCKNRRTVPAGTRNPMLSVAIPVSFCVATPRHTGLASSLDKYLCCIANVAHTKLSGQLHRTETFKASEDEAIHGITLRADKALGVASKREKREAHVVAHTSARLARFIH
jgi:hypothetical protein